MPIYIRFEDSKQIETTILSRKPAGTEWLKAPTEFDWHKCYCLDADNNIQERTEDDVSQEFVGNAKVNAETTISQTIDKYRREYAGYSFEKSESYRIQATAARSILQANKAGSPLDQEDVDAIKPLADLRNIDVIEMATLIIQKAREAKRALAKLEECEDKTEQELAECTTLDAVSQYLNNLESAIETALNIGE
jgi:hypothetical protein